MRNKKIVEPKEIKKIEPKIERDDTPLEDSPAPVELIGKRVGLNEKIDSISEKLEILTNTDKFENKKTTKLLKYNVKRQLKSLWLKNKVLIVLLKTNRAIHTMTAEIREGMIVVNGVPHSCSTDFVYLWHGKYPAIILPEWSLVPIGTAEYYTRKDSGEKSDAATTIIKMIERKDLIGGKALGGKNMIWLIIGAIVVLYLIFGGG